MKKIKYNFIIELYIFYYPPRWLPPTFWTRARHSFFSFSLQHWQIKLSITIRSAFESCSCDMKISFLARNSVSKTSCEIVHCIIQSIDIRMHAIARRRRIPLFPRPISFLLPFAKARIKARYSIACEYAESQFKAVNGELCKWQHLHLRQHTRSSDMQYRSFLDNVPQTRVTSTGVFHQEHLWQLHKGPLFSCYAIRSLPSRKEIPLSRSFPLGIIFESCSVFCYIYTIKIMFRAQLKEHHYSFYCRPCHSFRRNVLETSRRALEIAIS